MQLLSPLLDANTRSKITIINGHTEEAQLAQLEKHVSPSAVTAMTEFATCGACPDTSAFAHRMRKLDRDRFAAYAAFQDDMRKATLPSCSDCCQAFSCAKPVASVACA